MGPEWLQAYTGMLPRLIAQWQLAQLEVTLIPHMKKRDAQKAIKSIKARVFGGSGEYNEKGQLQLQNANHVRAWFSQFGYKV